MRFFTSCWVIVEPPCSIRPLLKFSIAARSSALGSMPSFVQNVLSSTAITASWMIFGTSERDTSSRLIVPTRAIWVPAES